MEARVVSIPATARSHLTAAAQHLSAAVETMGARPNTSTLRMVAAYVWRLAQRPEEA